MVVRFAQKDSMELIQWICLKENDEYVNSLSKAIINGIKDLNSLNMIKESNKIIAKFNKDRFLDKFNLSINSLL